MITITEWIGFGACVIAATALLSYLIYVKAVSEGHPPGVIWRALAVVWLCLGAAMAVLITARALLGGALFDLSLGQETVKWWVGGSHQIYVGAAAAAILVGLLWLALRSVRRLQEPPVSPDTEERNLNNTSSS